MSYENKVSEYRGFGITPKRDFGSSGFLIEGHMVNTGYVVMYGDGHEYKGCNAMPGATWFQTVKEAKSAIDDFIAVDEDGELFWQMRNARNAFVATFAEEKEANELKSAKAQREATKRYEEEKAKEAKTKQELLDKAELETRTSGYGIWLACTNCGVVHTIKDSRGGLWPAIETKDVAKVFKRHGWTGKGENLTNSKCPLCSNKKGSG